MTENVGLNTPVEQISAEEYQAPSNSSKIIHKLTAYLKEHFFSHFVRSFVWLSDCLYQFTIFYCKIGRFAIKS